MAWSTGNPKSGAPNGSTLGLSTGTTWHGNTAYGPAGGMAAGYATSNGYGNLGNFKALNGAPMSGMYGSVTGPPPAKKPEQKKRTPTGRPPGVVFAPGTDWGLGGMFTQGGRPTALGRFARLLGFDRSGVY